MIFSEKNSDLTSNSVIKIETKQNPNPTTKTLQKIAKALDVSIENLIK